MNSRAPASPENGINGIETSGTTVGNGVRSSREHVDFGDALAADVVPVSVSKPESCACYYMLGALVNPKAPAPEVVYRLLFLTVSSVSSGSAALSFADTFCAAVSGAAPRSEDSTTLTPSMFGELAARGTGGSSTFSFALETGLMTLQVRL